MGKLSFGKYVAIFCLLCLACPIPSRAASFSMFPNAGRLISPDGRFEVRDVEQAGAPGGLVGSSRSLWVIEIATGRSRKLCDYLGLAAVAWSKHNAILITQYVGKKTSRALIFPDVVKGDAVMLDSGELIRLLSMEWRPTLRENDHIFVEAVSLEGADFHFRVWGYGKLDPNGFRWNCKYSLMDNRASCESAPQPR